MSEHDFEPIRGLPGALPAGESILWQGAPDWWLLAQRAFHLRSVALYFALLIAGRAAFVGVAEAALEFAPFALASFALLTGLAALTARTTVYTITNRRLVLRFGVALPKAINIPFAIVAGGALKYYGGGGDIAVTLTPPNAINYFLLWPHARPWKLMAPEPALRALTDAQSVKAILSEALRAAQAVGAAVPAPAATPERALTPA